MIDKVKFFFALLGVFGNQVNIQGLNYSSVRKSKVLQEFYLNPNNEIEMFKLIKGFGYQSFLDFGAYFGYFSLYAKKIAKIQNVIAYEADPDNFSQIVKFAKKNLVELEAINKAVGDVVGEIEFFKPVYKGTTKFPSHGQIGDPHSDSNNLYRGREYRKFLVTMDSIENIVNDKVDGLSLIKLDIEGFEERCLRSIEEFLKRAEEVDLLVEIMINDSNKNEVFSFLKECGFDAYLLTNAGLVCQNRPLTLPKPNKDNEVDKLRTLWKNHFFTKRPYSEISKLNISAFGYNI